MHEKRVRKLLSAHGLRGSRGSARAGAAAGDFSTCAPASTRRTWEDGPANVASRAGSIDNWLSGAGGGGSPATAAGASDALTEGVAAAAATGDAGIATFVPVLSGRALAGCTAALARRPVSAANGAKGANGGTWFGAARRAAHPASRSSTRPRTIAGPPPGVQRSVRGKRRWAGDTDAGDSAGACEIVALSRAATAGAAGANAAASSAGTVSDQS